MVSFVDNTIFTAADAGTGSFTVAAAAQGYQSPAARVVDGEQYRYRAQSANLLQWEIGTAVASNGGTVFYRSVAASSTGALVDFIAPPSVILTFSAADFLQQASIDNKLVPDWIDPSVVFMPGRTAPTSTIAKIANAIKDVVVLNGDPAETYFIAIVCNKDVTFNNQIWINRLSDGANVAIADPLEVDRVGVTVLEFGTAPRVKLAINYSELPATGAIYNDVSSPLLIRSLPQKYVSKYFASALEKFKVASFNPMRSEWVTFIGDSETWGVGASGASTTAPNTGHLTDARNNFDAPSFVNRFAKLVGQRFCNGEGFSTLNPVSAAYPAGAREYRRTLNVDVCEDPQFVVVDTATGVPVDKTVTVEAGATLGRTLDILPGQELQFRHVGDWWKLVVTTQSETSDASARPIVTTRGKLRPGSQDFVTTYEAVPSNGNLTNFYVLWDDWRVTIANPMLGAVLRIECIENHRAVVIDNVGLNGTWSGQWAPGTNNFDVGISTNTTTLVCQLGKNDRILNSVGTTTGPDNPTRTREGIKNIVVGVWGDKLLADIVLMSGSKALGTTEIDGSPAVYGYSMAEVSSAIGEVALECDVAYIDNYAVSAANGVPVYVSNGTTVSGTKPVTGITSTATLRDGMAAFGAGIPLGTTIRVTGATTIELSANATASATVSIEFGVSQTTDGQHYNDNGYQFQYGAVVDAFGVHTGSKYLPAQYNYMDTGYLDTDVTLAANSDTKVATQKAVNTAIGARTLRIGHAHIPFVLVSSGTMGNNGALSGVTAVPDTYDGSYVYFPANAIAAGVAAGFYWTVWSSPTAATVYNNIYTSGTPVAPSSPTAFVTTGPGAYTQTTGAYIVCYTLPIPGNTIGVNGTVRANGTISANNSATAKAVRLVFAGSMVLGAAGMSSTRNMGFVGGFSNRGVTNKQIPYSAAGLAHTATATALEYASIDTTASRDLTVWLNLLTTNTDTVILEGIDVELIPGVT